MSSQASLETNFSEAYINKKLGNSYMAYHLFLHVSVQETHILFRQAYMNSEHNAGQGSELFFNFELFYDITQSTEM